MKHRPFVFIGSSAEGLEVAKAIQANLDYLCETQIWSQGLFGLSEGTLETLVSALERFDFAILALTADDLTRGRGSEQNSPRDNVLFELGLFIGGLGRSRVFMVIDRTAKLKLPSDLAGITPASFEPPTAGTMQSAVGAACTAIESKIKTLGQRRSSGIAAQVAAHWWTGCLGDGYSENPDFFMTVGNRSQADLPWLNVHIFPSNTFRLEPTTEKTERLMAGQYAVYRFRMLSPDGQLTKWAKKFVEVKRQELSIRVFKDRSGDEALLIDYDLGGELYDRILAFKQALT
jgi:predicted nucleotide-binding protein with TIR-like domain